MEADWPCVDTRRLPRWRRRLDDSLRYGRLSRWKQWGFWPAFWFAIHSRYNSVCFGEGWGPSDWGHGHASVMAVHRWLCRRWVPANERYSAAERARWTRKEGTI